MADSSSSSDQKYRQYHPYQKLNVPIQNLYNLPTSPEFLFAEEATAQRRTWSENISYYTGSGYLSGAILGAAKGSVEGIKSAEKGDSLKLRLNRVLNSGGQAGRRFGNTLGTVGLIFAGLESLITNQRDQDDILNTVLAGLGTGAVYKAASGPRSVVVGGVVGAFFAGLAVAGKQDCFSILSITFVLPGLMVGLTFESVLINYKLSQDQEELRSYFWPGRIRHQFCERLIELVGWASSLLFE